MDSLVDYPSSSSEDELAHEQLNRQKKRKRSPEAEIFNMPKLPAFFSTPNTAASPIRKVKRRDDHKGRIRTVPHKEDNWATYIYCKVHLTSEIKALLPHLPQDDNIEILEEQHISLSRPVYFKKHQLDALTSDVKDALRGVRSFHVSFAQPAVLVNDEKTRAFYTLEVGKGYNELSACMHLVDKVMKKYRQPVFYDPPRFHTSIAWALDQKNVASINIPALVMEPILSDEYLISKVYVKMGNRLETIDLQ